jgi:hypothetical protein
MSIIQDKMGSYLPRQNKAPIDFNNKSTYTQLHLAVFEQEPKRNHNRYTVNLSYKVPGSNRFDKLNATILNLFEPMRWLRMDDAQSRVSDPFYMDFIKYRKQLLRDYKKDDILISPTVGFFHEVFSNGFTGDTYFDSYATLHWTNDEYEPIVNIRFFDWTYQSIFLEEDPQWELGSKKPRWRELIYLEPNKHIKVS